MAQLPASVEVADESVLEFFGAPGLLHALVPVHNGTADPLRLRRTVAARIQRLPAEGEVHPTHVGRRAMIPPGGTQDVRLHLAVAPHTPPGDYEVEVDIGGGVRAAVLHVTEVVALTVSPGEIVLDNSSDEQLHEITVSNTGNVDIFISTIAVPLDDELLECRSFRAAAREFANGDHRETDPRRPTFDEFLVEWVRQTDRALQNAGLLRVRSVDGEITVPPGQTRVIKLGFTVPDTVDKHTRFSTFIPIAVEDLVVRVVPSLAPGAPPKQRRQTRTASRRRSS